MPILVLYFSRPNLGASIHCISVFLVRLVLLMIVTFWLRRRGLQEIQIQARRLGDRNKAWLQRTVNVLSFWVPMRLMCPGVILRLGHFLCKLTSTYLPAKIDVINMFAHSHVFWVVYAWTEVSLFAAMFYVFFSLKQIARVDNFKSGDWFPNLGGRFPRYHRQLGTGWLNRMQKLVIGDMPESPNLSGTSPRSAMDTVVSPLPLPSMTRRGTIYNVRQDARSPKPSRTTPRSTMDMKPLPSTTRRGTIYNTREPSTTRRGTIYNLRGAGRYNSSGSRPGNVDYI